MRRIKDVHKRDINLHNPHYFYIFFLHSDGFLEVLPAWLLKFRGVPSPRQVQNGAYGVVLNGV